MGYVAGFGGTRQESGQQAQGLAQEALWGQGWVRGAQAAPVGAEASTDVPQDRVGRAPPSLPGKQAQVTVTQRGAGRAALGREPALWGPEIFGRPSCPLGGLSFHNPYEAVSAVGERHTTGPCLGQFLGLCIR